MSSQHKYCLSDHCLSILISHMVLGSLIYSSSCFYMDNYTVFTNNQNKIALCDLINRKTLYDPGLKKPVGRGGLNL